MHSDLKPPPNYLFYWISLASLTVVFVFSLFIWPPYLHDLPAGYKAAQATLFLGRFHPIVLHLPIGMLAMSLLLELGCMKPSIEVQWREMAMLTEFATAVSGVVAVMFGIFLGREGGYHGGDYILHQVMGIVAVFGIIIACFLRVGWMMTDRGAWLDGFRFFLFASAGVLGLGAHFGGNISHGDKFLTEYAPPMMAKPMEGLELWLKSFVEPKKKTEDNPKPPVSTGSSATKHVFNDLILPVLEAKCNKCHNEAKSKGELRMDTYQLAMKGGENGKNFVPGKPEDSLSIQRINLAEDEDDHMPPQGKDQLTKEEIALITWWIKEGASDQLKVNDMELKAILGSGTKS